MYKFRKEDSYMSSYYDDEDIDSEEVLLPELKNFRISLIQENIKMQLINPFESSNDFVAVFDQQCEESLAEDDFSQEVISRVNEERIRFYTDVIDLISDSFMLDCDTDTLAEKNIDTLSEICSAIYRFFILKRKKNIKNMLLNYIITHEKEISDVMDYLKRRKDVVSIDMRKRISDENLAMIVANIHVILSYIKSLNINMDEMIKYSDMEVLSNYIVNDLMQTGIINDNFQELYFSPVFGFYSNAHDEIVHKIERGLIKAARRRE